MFFYLQRTARNIQRFIMRVNIHCASHQAFCFATLRLPLRNVLRKAFVYKKPRRKTEDNAEEKTFRTLAVKVTFP